MRQYLDFLAQNPLFDTLSRTELERALDCLDARTASFPKGSLIFLAGNPAERVGILLEGSAQVIREDLLGNREILGNLGPGDLFGEVFACAGVDTLPVSVAAVEPCTALLIDYRRIISLCPASCSFHSRMVENMLRILARKNLMLNRKMEALSARSTRDKLMTYLTACARDAGSLRFEIPFRRQELADYLSVDRSAMSAELGRMQRDGLLTFTRNRFQLNSAAAGD